MPGITSFLGRRRSVAPIAAAALVAATSLSAASKRAEDEPKPDESAEDAPVDEQAEDDTNDEQANEPVEDDTDTAKGKKSGKKSGKSKAEDAPKEDDEEEYAAGTDAARLAIAEERKRVAQLTDFFADRDPKFGAKAVAQGWTLLQSKAKWADTVKPGAKGVGSGGNRPVGSQRDAADDDDAGDGFDANAHPFIQAVAAKQAKGMTREKAVAAVVRERPDLQDSYNDDYNAARRVNRRR